MADAKSVADGTHHPPTQAVPTADPDKSGALSLVRIALWFGALAWLIELAILSFRKFALGHERVWNPEAVWMGPLVYALLFGLAGGILQLLGGKSRRTWIASVFLLALAATAAAVLVLPALHPAASLLLAVGIGARVAAWARAPEGFNPIVRRTLVPAALVIAVTAAIAAAHPIVRERIMQARLPAAASGTPNIVFIILDTVRAWNLSLYGHDRPTTPELERLAARGVTFDLALSTAPYTLPSHMSAFSGLYPGAMDAIRRLDFDDAVPASRPMLAEVLAEHGYATAGFVANLYYTSAEFGLTRGFARYEDFPVSFGQFLLSTAPGRRITNNGRFRRLAGFHNILNRKHAAHIVDNFLDWRADVGDRPFFAFLNFYDAHEPYLPPSPFEERFVREPPSGGFFYDTDRVQRLTMRDLPAGETRAQMDRYDGAIASLDAQLGRLFESLEREGVLDNTIVVITSDHGEEFMEHGKLGHVQYMYMSLLHVPLVIVAPGGAPAGLRVPAPVSIADLPATVLDLARLRQPEPMPGTSLTRFWRAEPADPAPILAEANPGKNHRKSVLDGRYHYIRNMDEPPELYDIVADRLEQRNLAAHADAALEVRRLDALLETLLRLSASGATMPATRTSKDPPGN